jgi:MoxR-like ATPase
MINIHSQSMTVEDVAVNCTNIVTEVEKAVIGKHEVLQKMMAAFLTSGGHILLEDYPGLAKTLIANSFARVFGMEFKRIQFTPDLLPGDISGGFIYNNQKNEFILRKGPIFTQILLADEINRASPKTQSALLEAMQENQVSLEGEVMKLPDPFLVIATQNPIEYEGTFPLPEAQLDRFCIRLSIGYPNVNEEKEILMKRCERKEDSVFLKPIVTSEEFLSMRNVVEGVFVDPDIHAYIAQLILKTRQHSQVDLGASPRGSLALLKLSRAWAVINGRDFVIPDDVKTFAQPALCHRIILNPNLWGIKKAESTVISEIVNSVAVPVLSQER